MTALKSIQENASSLKSVATAFTNHNSRLSDQFGGAVANMNKWLDPENNPSAKWFNTETSALGKIYYSSFIVSIEISQTPE